MRSPAWALVLLLAVGLCPALGTPARPVPQPSTSPAPPHPARVVAPVAEPSGSPEVLTRAQRAERDPKMAIPKVMKKQEIAWNRGDIQGFMEGYMESPSISFTSGGVLVHGWQTLLERYQKRYGDSRKSMGTLRFEHLQITPLGRNYALCVGQWFLQPYLPGDAMTSPSLKRGPLDGVFSLVWARTPEGWRIIHDHSSARAEK